jgi:formate hydrogenlyase subunit 6/NADH:ubiquinone oxidoreductase subunit I
MFDRSRCLPYAHYENCMVCEEVCPTPKKSIWFRDVEAKDRNGDSRTVKRPFVDLRLCTGCGICVNKCPIVDAPGVRVTSIGETRSRRNQLLLGGGPGPY